MRKILFLVWILLPVPVVAYHLGPGQDRMTLDDVSILLSVADANAANQKWAEAVDGYNVALTLLPKEKVAETRRIRLERAKAQMFVKKLPEAHKDLTSLVDEMQDDKNADPKVLRSAREALANSQYYMTWLMRLEGQPKEEWQPEIEAARQTFRLLAETAKKKGDAKSVKKNKEDLESSIRLARMNLTDLQGLPLPNQ